MKHHLKVPSIPREESTVSVLEHEVTIIGTRGKARCRALFDSAASYSIVRSEIAERVGRIEGLPTPEDWVFETSRPRGDRGGERRDRGWEFGSLAYFIRQAGPGTSRSTLGFHRSFAHICANRDIRPR